jgi:DNA polymerase-3 subunit epsilon
VFSAVVDEFLSFIAADRLVIHNAEFDMRFLNAELRLAGRDSIPMDRVVDTLALARRKHPGSPNSLDALCDRYRIDRSRRVKHGALLDAEILVEVYSELTGGRQTSFALSSEPKTTRLAAKISGSARMRNAPLPPRLAEADFRIHAAHVATLGEGAIWLRYAEGRENTL